MGIKERRMGIVGMTICHTVFIYIIRRKIHD